MKSRNKETGEIKDTIEFIKEQIKKDRKYLHTKLTWEDIHTFFKGKE